jgi:hypothetical protein
MSAEVQVLGPGRYRAGGVEVAVRRLGGKYAVTVSRPGGAEQLVARDLVSQRVVQLLRRAGLDAAAVNALLSLLARHYGRGEAEGEGAVPAPRAIFAPEGSETAVFFLSGAGWRAFHIYEIEGRVTWSVREARAEPEPLGELDLFWHYVPADLGVLPQGEVGEDDAWRWGVAVQAAVLDVRELLRQHAALRRPELYDVLAAWDLKSYVTWASSYAEQLIIRKPGYGHGGTVVAAVTALLGARPLMPLALASAASLYRLVDFHMPTAVIDETMRQEVPEESRKLVRLVAELSWWRHYRVPRYDPAAGRVVAFSPYCNVIIVDTHLETATYSAERRAWIVPVTEAQPVRELEPEDLLRDPDARRAIETLYSLGVAWPLLAREQLRRHRARQGTGLLEALREWAAAAGLDALFAVIDSALREVRRQLETARQDAGLTDPVRRLGGVIEAAIAEVREDVRSREFRVASPDPEREACGRVRLDRLRRMVAARLMEVHQIDVPLASEESEAARRAWLRVPREYEELLKPARLRALLRALDSAAEVVLDAATRNYYVRVCA